MWEKTCRLIASYLFINKTRSCDTKLCGSVHVTLCEVRNIQNPMAPQRQISQALTPLSRKDAGPTAHTTNAFTWYFALKMLILSSVRYRLLLLSRFKTVFKSGIDKLCCSGHIWHKMSLSFQRILLIPLFWKVSRVTESVKIPRFSSSPLTTSAVVNKMLLFYCC